MLTEDRQPVKNSIHPNSNSKSVQVAGLEVDFSLKETLALPPGHVCVVSLPLFYAFPSAWAPAQASSKEQTATTQPPISQRGSSWRVIDASDRTTEGFLAAGSAVKPAA